MRAALTCALTKSSASFSVKLHQTGLEYSSIGRKKRFNTMVVKVMVIGAGVIGLSTALNIQSQIPGSEVTVVAEKVNHEIASFGSGGLWFPTRQVFPNETMDKMRKWSKDSWDFYRQLATGPEAGKCGACISNGYVVTRNEWPDPLFKDYVFSYRKLKDEEFRQFNFPSEFKHGYNASTIILDQGKYLKWLMDRFTQDRGKFEQRKIYSLTEFVGKCDVVVNCSGLGSRELVGDDRMYAVRGQLIRVNAPWTKNWFCDPDPVTGFQTFIIPGENLVVLGGTKQVRDENMEVSPADTEDILQRCYSICPHLKHAEIDHVWVGLRPGRDKLRLEAEELKFNHQKLKVVHNYGHNSIGVSLAWGTAMEAADLARKSLTTAKARL